MFNFKLSNVVVTSLLLISTSSFALSFHQSATHTSIKISKPELVRILVDDDLQDCYDDCKDSYATGSNELKSCIFGCIYPEDEEK